MQENQSSPGFHPRFDTKRAVQPQKVATSGYRNMKFLIYEEEGLYYLCSKNKGVDQNISCAFAFTYAKSGFLMLQLICVKFPAMSAKLSRLSQGQMLSLTKMKRLLQGCSSVAATMQQSNMYATTGGDKVAN